MIQAQVAGRCRESFFLSYVDGGNPRGSALAGIEIVPSARGDSAISFAWKRRIETFFPRTSTLILNENEPLVKSLVSAGDEMRHGSVGERFVGRGRGDDLRWGPGIRAVWGMQTANNEHEWSRSNAFGHARSHNHLFNMSCKIVF